jgi:hypothetical protein
MFVQSSYSLARSMAKTAADVLDKPTRTQEDVAFLANASRTLPQLLGELKGCPLDLTEIRTVTSKLVR